MLIAFCILYILYCCGKISDIEREEAWEEYRQAKLDLRHRQLMRSLERIERNGRKGRAGKTVECRRTVSTGVFGQSVCEEVVVRGLERRELDDSYGCYDGYDYGDGSGDDDDGYDYDDDDDYDDYDGEYY